MTIREQEVREAGEHLLRAMIRWRKYWEAMAREHENGLANVRETITDLGERIVRLQQQLGMAELPKRVSDD